MNNNAIKIRNAKPELEEGYLFAEYLNEASEGFFKSILGKDTFEIIADAFLKSNNDYSYENVSVIEYDSKIVGMVSGYTKSEKECFNGKILYQSSKGSKHKKLIFSIISRILSRFLGPPQKGDFYIIAIAVNYKMRGQGLGQKLLEHISAKAIEKGSVTLSLDVSGKNSKAINSYKRFGMKVTSFWPNFLNISPIFTRMEKQL